MNYEIIELLCSQKGVSGRERPVMDAIEKIFKGFSCKRDALGNLSVMVREPKNGKKTVMLEAHADRIGLYVSCFREDGFIGAAGAGIDPHTLMGSEVEIEGIDGPVTGVVAAPFPYPAKPHNSAPAGDYKMPPIDALYIDTGLENPQKHIPLGAPITMSGKVRMLLGDRVCAPCLDNRAGCAAVILAGLELAKADVDNGVVLLFATREEMGGQGAMTGSFGIQPDFAVAVDVTYAEAPDVTKEQGKPLGSGPAVGYSSLLDYEISKMLCDIAKAHNIPHEMEIMGGRTGTDSDAIAASARGVRTGLLSIPQRFMHHPTEVISLADVENTKSLLVAFAAEVK